MDSINVKAAILIGVMALAILLDVIRHIYTRDGVNRSDLILCALILVFYWIYFSKKKSN
jgi:hypothetical protein